MKKIIFALSLLIFSLNVFSQNTGSLPYWSVMLPKASVIGTDSCAVFDHATLKWKKIICSSLGASSPTKVNVSGDTMTGNLMFPNDGGITWPAGNSLTTESGGYTIFDIIDGIEFAVVNDININAGAALHLESSALSLNTVPYLNGGRDLVSSAVTPTELGYLSGVTSGIQAQLNAKGTGSVSSVGMTGDNVVYNTSVTGSPVTTSGTFVPSLKTQTATYGLRGPITGSATAPTFRADDRRDLNSIYTEIGQIFTEPWTNLTAWSNVGTPVAAVSGGYLTMAGTASLSTNYIKNNTYGNCNIEKADYTWTEVVGTIASSARGGIALSLQGNVSTFPASITVNLNVSTTSQGKILWYYNNATTAVQSSASSMTVAIGDTLTCKLSAFPDRYEFYVTNSSGVLSNKDIFWIFNGPGAVYTPASSINFSFQNFGQGATPHKVGAFTVIARQKKNVDYLWIGDSQTRSGSNYSFWSRFITKLNSQYYSVIEANAAPGNRCGDVNLTECALYNPKNIVLFIGSNDVSSVGAATAFTNLQSLITSLGSTTTTAAPSGYSIANNNLFICTLMPRGSAVYYTFNSSVKSTYPKANIIDLTPIVYDGTNNYPLQYSFDGVHQNDLCNRMILIITYKLIREQDQRGLILI